MTDALIQKTVIDGLMVFHPGRYIRCDNCNDPTQDFTIFAGHGLDGQTEKEAESVGWRIVRRGPHSSQHEHFCPNCAVIP